MKKKMVSVIAVFVIILGLFPNITLATSGSDIAARAAYYEGVSRDIYDCSAYTQQVYADCGISIPRQAKDQANCGTKVYSSDLSMLKAGDIICFGSSSGSITHVGIYDGSGGVWHSSYSYWKIRKDSLSAWMNSSAYTPPYQFAVRVVSDDTNPPSNPQISLSATTLAAGQTLTVNYSATNANNYRVEIWHNNELQIVERGSETSAQITLSEAGGYVIYVQCLNDYGSVDTESIGVSVTENITPTPAPSLSDFTVEKYNGYANIINNTSEQQGASVIFAKYNNGVLIDTEICEAHIAAEGTLKINTDFGNDYKVFVWDSLSGMKPLCESE